MYFCGDIGSVFAFHVGARGFYSPWGQNSFFQLDFICNFSKVLILYVIFRQGNSYLRNYFIVIYVILVKK